LSDNEAFMTGQPSRLAVRRAPRLEPLEDRWVPTFDLFRTSTWGALNPPTGYSTHLAGDFDGDFVPNDVVHFRPAGAGLYVSHGDATAKAFTTLQWGTLSPTTGWGTQVVGDFDSDDHQDDIASFHKPTNSWYVSLGDGATRTFTTTKWGSLPGGGWGTHQMGDFDGDGFQDDIASFQAATGSWYVSLGDPATKTFTATKWGALTPKTGWGTHLVGDFDGDFRRDDVASFHKLTHTWYVSLGDGTSKTFTAVKWATLPAGTAWGSHLAGDFDADGSQDDIGSFDKRTGRWYVSRGQSTSAEVKAWGTQPAGRWTRQVAGFFGGTGASVAAYNAATGSWWVGQSNGGQFTFDVWADYDAPKAWAAPVVGDFNGDFVPDILDVDRAGGGLSVNLASQGVITNANAAITDNATTTSQAFVTGLSGTVVDVDVRINLNHTFDADLHIFLVAPDGTRVELTRNRGGNSDNYNNTIFDDEAPVAVAGGYAPFSGRFQPEGLLSALDGQPANGTWTLEVRDEAGQDVGTLFNWELLLKTTTA
jgi:subtilisin-like proprotein convertase family protein